VKRLLPLLTAVVMIALWVALAARLPLALMPGPVEVARGAWADRDTLLQATLYTTVASLAGLGIAGTVALLVAIAFQWSEWLEVALYPYALLVQTVPIVAIAPLLVVWLGYGLPVAVASASIVSFFPILTSVNLGLRSTGRPQVELFRFYGATWTQELVRLRFPAALPYLFSGLRTAVGLSVIGAIVGEFVGSNGLPPSLGFVVLKSARAADTPLTFAAIFAATSLALILFSLTRLAERRMIGRWHTGGTTE